MEAGPERHLIPYCSSFSAQSQFGEADGNNDTHLALCMASNGASETHYGATFKTTNEVFKEQVCICMHHMTTFHLRCLIYDP